LRLSDRRVNRSSSLASLKSPVEADEVKQQPSMQLACHFVVRLLSGMAMRDICVPRESR